MTASKTFLPLLGAVLVAGVFVQPSWAQNPASYNAQRAYQQYLNSPSPVRTYSSYQSGQTWGYKTPLQSGRFWLTPGYYHEEISPSGRQSYTVPQQEGGYVVNRPVV